jgi:ribosome-binding ATPase YchF (GTP1/OBG family)
MKIGLVGFAGSGKSTVFQWLTGVTPDAARVQQGQTGMAKVPDDRVDRLAAIFKPKKTTYAEVAFLDTPGLDLAERRDNPRRLGILREANGLLVVLNGYSGGDPAKELDRFREESAFADLEIVTNRISKVQANLRKPRPAKEKEIDEFELDVLLRVKACLEDIKPASSLGLKPEEEKAVRSFQLLTLKPEMAFVNQGEANAPIPKGLPPETLAAPVKLELELAELSPEDRAAFMADLGVTTSQRDEMLRNIMVAMGQIVFLTCGEDECRSWPIDRGIDAVNAAGAIHTDLSKRFVRAEVVSFADFLAAGSMKEAKAKGTYRLEGKTYIVNDGDIMHILASS